MLTAEQQDQVVNIMKDSYNSDDATIKKANKKRIQQLIQEIYNQG